MTIRVAINGFGRIGRNVLRAHYESGKAHDIEIVAVNSPGDVNINAHLLRYDSCHGRFNASVETDGDDMIVNGDRMRVFGTRDPRELPWADLGVDLVMECTGAFNSKEKSQVHDDRLRRQPQEPEGFGPHRLERLLHDELPRSARQAPAGSDRS